MLYRNDQISVFEKIEVYENGDENFTHARYLFSLLDKLQEETKKVVMYQSELDMKLSDFSFISEVHSKFGKVVEMWSILNEWEREHNMWISTPVLDLNANEIRHKVSLIKKRMGKLFDMFSSSPSLSKLSLGCIGSINMFDMNYLELMTILRHESFKDRHWRELLNRIWKNEPPRLESLTFKQLIDMNIKSHKSLINNLAENANKEYIIEFKIDEIEKSMCNTQVVVKYSDKCGKAFISNEQFVRSSFLDHRQRLEDMLRSSEHLETFLELIYKVMIRVDKLEKAFDALLGIQKYLAHLKVLKIVNYFAVEIGRKDYSLVEHLLTKYSNVFDDLKTRGLAQLMSNIVEKEVLIDDTIKLEKQINEVEPESSKVPQNVQLVELSVSTGFKTDSHEDNLNTLKDIYEKMANAMVHFCSSTPRLALLSPQVFCDIIHSTHRSKMIRFLEVCFPEIHTLIISDDNTKIEAAKSLSQETILFEKPVIIEYTIGVEIHELIKTTVNEIQFQIKRSLKSSLLKGLNYFLQNSYNYEKFLSVIIDQNIPIHIAEVTLRTVMTQDVSLMLDNCFTHTTKENHRIRFQKYLNMITNPLRKINLLTYRETANQGNRNRMVTVESYISTLVYLADQISDIIKRGDFTFGSFYWQSKIKFCVKTLREKNVEDLAKQTGMENYMKLIEFALKEVDYFSNLFYLSLGTRSLTTLEMNVNVFDTSIPYGYQPSSESHRSIHLPTTEKGTVTLFLAVSKEKMVAIRGQDCGGKTTTVDYLSRLLGKHVHLVDCSMQDSGTSYLHKLMTAAGLSHWVVLKNVHEASIETIQELGRMVGVVKKYMDTNEKKQVMVDTHNYILSPYYCFFWVQPGALFVSDKFQKIPLSLLAAFRSSCFVTLDPFVFIYSNLVELMYIEEYNQKLIESISRNLLLLFQMLDLSLNDRSLFNPNSIKDSEVSVEHLLSCQRPTWKFSPASAKPILRKVVHFLRMDQTSVSNISKTIYKAVYSVMKYQLSSQQKESLMVTYLATMDPASDSFEVRDRSYDHEAFTIYNFFQINKIPSFSNVGLLENIHAVADSIQSVGSKVYLNYGNQLQAYSDTFNKLTLFTIARRLNSASNTGIMAFTFRVLL